MRPPAGGPSISEGRATTADFRPAESRLHMHTLDVRIVGGIRTTDVHLSESQSHMHTLDDHLVDDGRTTDVHPSESRLHMHTLEDHLVRTADVHPAESRLQDVTIKENYRLPQEDPQMTVQQKTHSATTDGHMTTT